MSKKNGIKMKYNVIRCTVFFILFAHVSHIYLSLSENVIYNLHRTYLHIYIINSSHYAKSYILSKLNVPNIRVHHVLYTYFHLCIFYSSVLMCTYPHIRHHHVSRLRQYEQLKQCGEPFRGGRSVYVRCY